MPERSKPLYRSKCVCQESEEKDSENPDRGCDHVLRIAYVNPEKYGSLDPEKFEIYISGEKNIRLDKGRVSLSNRILVSEIPNIIKTLEEIENIHEQIKNKQSNKPNLSE